MTVRVPPPQVFMLLPPQMMPLIECYCLPNGRIHGSDEAEFMFRNLFCAPYTGEVVWCEHASQAVWPFQPEIIALRRRFERMNDAMAFRE